MCTSSCANPCERRWRGPGVSRDGNAEDRDAALSFRSRAARRQKKPPPLSAPPLSEAGYEPPAEYQRAATLGWCVEWLQAMFLVMDDIMDESVTRRGQPCWYKHDEVKMNAINDGLVLECQIYSMLKKHLKGTPCYADLLEMFHDVTHQTAHGQLIDLITAPIGVVDLSNYTEEAYIRIVTYKTAFYTFYLPAASAMRLSGITDEASYAKANEICQLLGQFFQIQDDYLDLSLIHI